MGGAAGRREGAVVPRARVPPSEGLKVLVSTHIAYTLALKYRYRKCFQPKAYTL